MKSLLVFIATCDPDMDEQVMTTTCVVNLNSLVKNESDLDPIEHYDVELYEDLIDDDSEVTAINFVKYFIKSNYTRSDITLEIQEQGYVNFSFEVASVLYKGCITFLPKLKSID